MSKKAVIIVGPEGCGNRLIASAFQRAGCLGEGSTRAEFNTKLPPADLPGNVKGVVLIRSFPHGDEWVDLVALDKALHDRGYETTYVVTTRDFSCYAGSWIKDRPDEADGWQGNYQRAYLSIFRDLGVICAPFIVASYESVMMRQSAFLSRLVTQCGFPYDFFTLTVDGIARQINDANTKYY